MSNSYRALATAALCMTLMAVAGCAGTKAAYQAADTLEDRAYVVTEHYSAIVKQAADLKDLGVLKGSALSQVREIETSAQPVVLSLRDLVANYNAAKTAETEVALQKALDDAVRLLANLVRVVKTAASGGAT
jgi:hydroxymethylpyrimidine pyrophosphatase-like HAD family hydrolase